MMIQQTNTVISTGDKYLCVSRPRRFGKSMAANMLCAYYDESCDSKELFHGLKIEDDPSFPMHLNKYPVIHLDIAGFISDQTEKKGIVGKLTFAILDELHETYRDILTEKQDTVALALAKVYEKTDRPFVFIIDEWDALFREYPNNTAEQDAYLGFLRSLFKNSAVGPAIALAYMTGILPIKKYNTQSVLNNFTEYNMLDPEDFAPFVVFAEDEVEALCRTYRMDFDEMKKWYDGYSFSPGLSIYSPYSVVNAIKFKKTRNYWTETSSFTDAKDYINMGFDGLKENITRMVSGEQCPVNVRSFENDFVTLHDKNQVMTLLIHLGYLAYNQEEEKAYIPNLEVSQKMSDAIIASNWVFSSKALHDSKELLGATWDEDEEKVAGMVESTHEQLYSFMSYNQKSDLTLVICLAYYAAVECYQVRRELTAGKGYADVTFIPRKGCQVPPMIVELKWDKSTQAAMEQVRRKKYLDAFRLEYKEALVCGINYDTTDKEHTCRIEKVKLD